ncbi:hypothetical protein ACLOJK_026346 [Asimina triloba]
MKIRQDRGLSPASVFGIERTPHPLWVSSDLPKRVAGGGLGGVMDFNDEKKAESAGEEKSCTDCRTTKTPLWRGGPAGPKSLCNACGIKYRKKRRGLLGLKNREEKESNGKERREKLKARLDVLLKRSTLQMMRKRKLGEVEEAAVLLMTLSCGFVSAT